MDGDYRLTIWWFVGRHSRSAHAPPLAGRSPRGRADRMLRGDRELPVGSRERRRRRAL